MISSCALLSHRVNALEKTYVGVNLDKAESGALHERVSALTSRLDSIGVDVPAIQTVYDQMVRLQPLIQKKKESAAAVAQRVDQILARRDLIEGHFMTITKIEGQTKFINTEGLDDIEGHERQLEALRNSLDPLLVSAKEQSQEIDELLNIYEQTMAVLSDVCSSWETTLKERNIE